MTQVDVGPTLDPQIIPVLCLDSDGAMGANFRRIQDVTDIKVSQYRIASFLGAQMLHLSSTRHHMVLRRVYSACANSDPCPQDESGLQCLLCRILACDTPILPLLLP